jgi:peptidoglycan/LPS O-acetylase OafA/YrhL
VRRLLPAAVALVVSVCALSLLVLPRLSRVNLVSDARAALLYVANWHFLGSATDYFADDVQRSPFLHFWSLAIEEQFYFVFPVVMVGLMALVRRTARAWVLPAGLLSLLGASVALQIVSATGDQLRAYYGTDTRLYQLLAGAALAAVRHRLVSTPGRSRIAGPVGAVGVMALIVLATDALGMSVSTRGIAAAAITTVVVAAFELAPVSAVGAALSTAPFTYLGRISYGTYLWHWPIIVLVGAGFVVSPGQLALIAVVAATAVSAASYKVFETPIRRSPHLDRHPRAVVVLGLACSVLIAATVVPALLHRDRRPTWTAQRPAVAIDTDVPGVDSALLAAAMDLPAPKDQDLSVTEPPEFDQTACTAVDLEACVLHRGSGMRLHLIGDSNAMVMIPLFLQLAEQYDFTLTVTARVGCPWQLGVEWKAQDTVLVRHCVEARDEWYSSVIPALQPDVVVAVHVPRDEGSREDAFFTDGTGRPVRDVVRDGTDRSLDRFREMGARVVLFEPLPYDRHDPTVCLSGAATVGACAYEANSAPFPTELLYRDEAAARDDVWVVDPDRLGCPYLPVCVPLIDGELVFRNQFHLSNQWVLDHADEWWAEVVDTGALAGWFEPD